MRFVNSYFNTSSSPLASSRETQMEKKFLVLTGNTADQFNPLNYNSLNEQLTPISLHISEQYQALLHDYCVMSNDEFIQSQIYLCLIVALLSIYSLVGKAKSASHKAASRGTDGYRRAQQLAANAGRQLVSGKMVANQHEANLNIENPVNIHYNSNSVVGQQHPRHLFSVTIVSVPIYLLSLVVHSYASESINRDIICCVSMVALAFSVLITIFLPLMFRLHQKHPKNRICSPSPPIDGTGGPSDAAMFSMFPELAVASSNSDSSGAGSRKAFAETKKSREKIGAVLAHIETSPDSLRDMGLQNANGISPAELNLKLNLPNAVDQFAQQQELASATVHAQRRSQGAVGDGPCSRKRKKLIMIDVDPRCPRHGCTACKR